MLSARRMPFLLVLIVASLPLAAQQRSGLAAGKIKEIEQAISSEMSRQNIPALSVAIAIDSRPSWSSGFGMSDLENFVDRKSVV